MDYFNIPLATLRTELFFTCAVFIIFSHIFFLRFILSNFFKDVNAYLTLINVCVAICVVKKC